MPAPSILVLAAALAAPAAPASPWLPVQDHSPLTRGFYLPTPGPLPGESGLAVTAAVANTTHLGDGPGELLLVDGEFTTVEFAWSGAGLPAEGHWRVRLPVYHQGAGALDSAIDRWHSWFGLDPGARRFRDRDLYAVRYLVDGAAPVDVPQGTALGDLKLEGSWTLQATATRRLFAGAGLELPTGRESRLGGNGALDGGAWLGVEQGAALPAWLGARSVTLGALGGVAVAGGAGALPDVRRFAPTAALAFDVSLAPRWHLGLQLDWQARRVLPGRAKLTGNAFTVALAARHVGAQWSTAVGFSEDADVGSAADVAFFLRVARAVPRP
jgi:Protein of unknown function (DUF3187)